MYFSPTSELGMIQAKTGYKFDSPTIEYNKVYYLEVVHPLKWKDSESIIDHNLIPVGSLTWAYNYCEEECVRPENNKFRANVDAKCFRLVSISGIEKVKKKEETLSYRIKTKEEFIQDGNWIYRDHAYIDKGYPKCWESSGKMNKYLVKLATDEQNVEIELAKKSSLSLKLEGWTFSHSNFIEASVIPPEKKTVTHQKDEEIDWKDLAEQHPPIPTFRHPDYISYGATKENLTDDIVIESTINITI